MDIHRRSVRCALVFGLLCIGVGVALLIGPVWGDVDLEDVIWSAYRDDHPYHALDVVFPFDGTLFPPEIVAPTFRWRDGQAEVDTWLITVRSDGGES